MGTEMNKRFHIHGDNIVECERTLDLITQALDCRTEAVTGPLQSCVCPVFMIDTEENGTYEFTFFPGFGRWDEDIRDLIRQSGGVLREAADALVTHVLPTGEVPIIAVEYCAALAAGNQAWQRNGRAYSFARAHIPYLYIVELGGYELDSKRERKAIRLPNPAIPFSYVSCSLTYDITNLPICVPSPGADESTNKMYHDVFCDTDLLILISSLLNGKSSDLACDSLQDKATKLVSILAAHRRHEDSLDAKSWRQAEAFIRDGGTLCDYIIENNSVSWSKTAYIESLTNTASLLMTVAAKHAIGLTSTNLPFCLIAGNTRKAFAEEIEMIYPDLSNEFKEWLESDDELVICWIMGFKPRGDDARPDRGLPPFTRMLIGDDTDMLTVVYGPAPVASWHDLHTAPERLIERNGLWEAILNLSDAVLIDSATDADITEKGYVSSHFQCTVPETLPTEFLVTNVPKNFGENDVDTVLHLVFSRIASKYVFEGMCNPPGGDWSGISILTDSRDTEVRWLSLPRVGEHSAKRPDHVFQILGVSEKPIALIVESKETGKAVEKHIGNRLKLYLTQLLSTPASCERPHGAKDWKHSDQTISVEDIQFGTAVAFLGNDPASIRKVLAQSESDMALGLHFSEDAKVCEIMIISNTELGKTIGKFIEEITSNSKLVVARNQ